MLHMLDQAALARTLFPVGVDDKADVRAVAAALGLRTAAKPDSQDVCFITSTGGRASSSASASVPPGAVVDGAGDEVGGSTRSSW